MTLPQEKLASDATLHNSREKINKLKITFISQYRLAREVQTELNV